MNNTKRIIEQLDMLLEHCISMSDKEDSSDVWKDDCWALESAISAMQELEKYREVGTLEECREAMEKQKRKKPDYEGDGFADGKPVYIDWSCPCCRNLFEVDYDEYDYCPSCGQHIDWGDEYD